MMGFRTAVKTCLQAKYADFKGRASRSEFWWFMLALFAANIVLGAVGILMPAIGSSITAGFALVILSPYAAALTRRLHDVNLSGKWVAAAFVLCVLASIAAGYPGLESAVFLNPAMFLALFAVALLPGTRGENRFGEPPA